MAAGGARYVVVLLDRSASMGYGDRWARAQEGARRVVRSLGAVDSGAVVVFAGDVEIAARSEAGSGAAGLATAIDRAKPGPGATKIGPAIRAAAGLLEAAAAPRREVVLVSDFQKTGWDPSQEVHLPAGVTLSTVSVSDPAPANAAIVGLSFEQVAAPKGALVTAVARVANYGASPVSDREIALEVDGHRVGSGRASVAAGSTTTVSFPPFAVAGGRARVTVRMAPDAMPADDTFNAVVVVSAEVPVLILESANPAADSGVYLARALEVAAAPGFAVRTVRADRVTPDEIKRGRRPRGQRHASACRSGRQSDGGGDP